MINRALQLFLLVMFTATVVVAQTPTTWSLESEKTEGALSKRDTVRIDPQGGARAEMEALRSRTALRRSDCNNG